MMSQAPRGNVGESILARLLAPHRDIARKRVTMLYRPIDPARAAAIVEADKRDAEFIVGSSRRPTGRSRKDALAAFANESEESGGAGLVNFGMVVTATVEDPATIEDARAAIDSLSAQARIRLRPVYGSQDFTFVAGLPLGVVLPRHLAIPHDIRDQL
nr:SCO6880 family protein [Frigoribacterium sp. CFBP 8754]